jgi:hypothetical protein
MDRDYARVKHSEAVSYLHPVVVAKQSVAIARAAIVFVKF